MSTDEESPWHDSVAVAVAVDVVGVRKCFLLAMAVDWPDSFVVRSVRFRSSAGKTIGTRPRARI